MTLIEDFRIELINILRNVVKKPLLDRTCRRIQNHGRTLSFPDKIATSYLRAIRVLRVKSRNMGKFISDKKLEELLVEFLFDIKYGDEARIMTEIDGHIVDLFGGLKSLQSQRYLFIIPIMNLRLEKNVSIGDSMLANLNEQMLASLENKHSVKLRFTEKSHLQAAEEIVKTNQTSVFAIVAVNAPDSEKAFELAKQKADTCLNILRLYNSDSPSILRHESKTTFLMKTIGVNLNEKSYYEKYGGHSLVNVPFLGSAVIEKMRKSGFETINRLLKETDKLNSLQNDILTAIFWFGNAVKEETRNMKLIKCIIALETLLIPDGGKGKREILSKRFASILYNLASDDEKKEAFRTMKSLYDIRNSIIHSGEGYVYEDDLSQVMYWTQATIQFLLQYAEKCKNISELIKHKFPVEEALYDYL